MSLTTIGFFGLTVLCAIAAHTSSGAVVGLWYLSGTLWGVAGLIGAVADILGKKS